MALTSTQKAQVRTYLGAPDNFRYKNTRLESVLENLSPEAEVQITDLLTKLAALEVLIATGTSSSALAVQLAGLKRVDEIWFETGSSESSTSTNAGFASLKEAGKFYVGRISIITGVPINASAFGSSGYPGDDFFPGFGSAPLRLG